MANENQQLDITTALAESNQDFTLLSGFSRVYNDYGSVLLLGD
jgi:hypothetical protein